MNKALRIYCSILVICLLKTAPAIQAQQRMPDLDKQVVYQYTSETWDTTLHSSTSYITHMVDFYTNQGRYHIKKGRFDTALIFLNQAVIYMHITPGLQKGLPSTYNAIADAQLEQDNFEQAVISNHHALSYAARYLSSPQRDKVMISSYISLGTIYNEIKLPQQALLFYNHANSLATRYGTPSQLANILLLKGSVNYSFLNNSDEGLKNMRAAYEIAKKYNLLRVKYLALNNLASTYNEMDSTHQVLNIARELDTFASWPEDSIRLRPANRAALLLTLANIYIKTKEFKKAEKYLFKGMRYAKRFKFRQLELYAHELFCKLYGTTGKAAQALSHQTVYVLLRDSIEQLQINRNLSELSFKYKVAETDRTLAQNQLLIEQQNNRLNRKNTTIAWGTTLFLLSLIAIILYRNKAVVRKRQMKIMKQENEITLLKGVMEGEQNERARLAGELHDGIGGMLAVLKIDLDATRKQYPELVQSPLVQKMDARIDATANEIRRTAHNLMPDALMRYSLKEALLLYRDNVCSDPDSVFIEILFIEQHIESLPDNIKLVVYRAIQEIIQNILKHASATTATIQLIATEYKLKVIAEDDGCGFIPEEGNRGIGFKNLLLKVQAHQGTLSVNAAPGQGTIIFIEFALTK